MIVDWYGINNSQPIIHHRINTNVMHTGTKERYVKTYLFIGCIRARHFVLLLNRTHATLQHTSMLKLSAELQY